MSKTSIFRNLFLFIFIIVSIAILPVSLVDADESDCEDIHCSKYKDKDSDKYIDCIEEEKQCWQKMLSGAQQQTQTLKNTISVLNGEIYLQELKVEQTRVEINDLETEIEELGNRIEGLATSLNHLAEVLIERVRNSYKSMRTNTFIATMATGSLKDTINSYQYRTKIQQQTVVSMQQAELQRMNYNEQKVIKEEKQDELEKKKSVFVRQQQSVERQKRDKQSLLGETQNNEAKYQELYAKAKAEVDSLKSFTLSQVGGQSCLPSSPKKEDGWYYSQRDPRWCKQRIAYSSESVGDVGCLLTSVAMIWTKHGHDRKPSEIAANSSYFSLRTAYMRSPLPSPPGYKYYRYNYRDYGIIDKELKADRPVIVHLRVGTYDGHFVVIKSGSDGNYKIFDPLFGGEVSLSSRYSSSMIDSVRVFKPG